MNTLQNNFGSCVVFKVVNRWARSLFARGVLGGAMALMFCHAALALDINQASEAELDSLKGMGPTLTAKVLTARNQAPFKNWSDLMQRVSGIRHHKAQHFSEQGLTVNGQSLGAGR